MEIRRNLRKLTELGIALTAISALILAGCGGGGASSAGTPSAATVSTTITPFKGRFFSGSVTLTDANGSPVTLLNGTGTINANGVAPVTFTANVTYPLTVSVNGAYLNEVTGASAVTSVPLRGFIPNATIPASGVPVTALSEMAVTLLQTQSPTLSGITSASAVAAITGAASGVLGQTYTQAMTPPVFDAQGKTSSIPTIQLAALAVVANGQGTGADLSARLNNVGIQLSAASAINVVIPQTVYDNAVAAVNGGASSVLPTGTPAQTMPATTISSATLASLSVYDTCCRFPTLDGRLAAQSPWNGTVAGSTSSCVANIGVLGDVTVTIAGVALPMFWTTDLLLDQTVASTMLSNNPLVNPSTTYALQYDTNTKFTNGFTIYAAPLTYLNNKIVSYSSASVTTCIPASATAAPSTATASQFAKLTAGNTWVWTETGDTRTQVMGVMTASGITNTETIAFASPASTMVNTYYTSLDATGSLIVTSSTGVIATVIPASLNVGTTWTRGVYQATVTGINTTHTVAGLGTFYDVMTLATTTTGCTGTEYWSMAVGNRIDATKTCTSATGVVTTTTSVLQPGYIAK